MTRPSFSTDLASNWAYQDWRNRPQSGVVAVARHCHETVSGVSRRKPDGWIPPTGYSFRREFYERQVGTCRYDEGNTWRQYSGVVGGSPVNNSLVNFDSAYVPFIDFAPHTDRALIKARLSMKDQSVNLGVAFAERNKTARLVGDTALQLARAYRHLRRDEYKKAARALGFNNPRKPRGNTVPQRWLELQYGWKPLLSDVYGAVDALAKRPSDDWIVTGKGSSFEDITVNSNVGSGYGACWCEVRGRKGVYVRIDAVPENELLLSLAALGVTNPLTVAWELVPYSFVVDWFLPVGSFLDSLDAMLGYGPTWCSISSLHKVRWDLKGRSYKEGAGYFTNTGTACKEFVHLDRVVSESVPLPSLPRFKDPVSLAHMANGLSLLASAFSGR